MWRERCQPVSGVNREGTLERGEVKEANGTSYDVDRERTLVTHEKKTKARGSDRRKKKVRNKKEWNGNMLDYLERKQHV